MQTSPWLSPHPCLVLPWSIRNHSFSLAGEHVWNGFVFTHLVSDAGLFNYPPSACHLEQQAVQIKPNGCAHPRRGGWKGILAFFFLNLTAGCILPCLSASQGIPPTKSSYVGRHQNRESLFAPRAEEPPSILHLATYPRWWGFPPNHWDP